MSKRTLCLRCPSCGKDGELRLTYLSGGDWDSKELYCGVCSEFFALSPDTTELLRRVYNEGLDWAQQAIRKQLGISS